MPNIPGVTIFDQDETQDQQNTGNAYSKNTIKAMKLLRDKCREEISEQVAESSTKPRQTVVSYESVVETVRLLFFYFNTISFIIKNKHLN